MKSRPDSHKQQEATRLHRRIDSFSDNFSIGSLLHQAGICKLRGVSPLMLLKAIFVLPFERDSFFLIVAANRHGFKKDRAYALLRIQLEEAASAPVGQAMHIIDRSHVMTHLGFGPQR